MQESFLDELSSRWAALPIGGRFVLLASVVASVGILALVVLWTKRPDYRPLYSNVRSDQAAAILQKLKTMKVPYQVGDDGESILVPSSVLYQTRMELAGSGLPGGGEGGFELFDKTRFQTSPLSERVTYMRALQGELEKTISSLQEVASVRVHLVLPQRELLVDEGKDTSASIVLQLKPGATLGPSQIHAIKALVAGAVPHLDRNHITLMDTRGVLLSTNDDNEESGAASSLLDLEHGQEKALERKTQDMLDQVLGPGMAVVRVTVELSDQQKTVESQQFVPTEKDHGVLRSEQDVGEAYTGSGGRSVLPSTSVGQKVVQAAGAAANSNYKNDRTTRNYEINTTHEKDVQQAGGIKRMTVAVGLSAALKLNRPALDDLTAMVTQATGADPARKDVVTVAVVPFHLSPQAAQTPDDLRQQKIDLWLNAGRATAPFAAVILFWLLAGRVGRGTRAASFARGTRPLAAGATGRGHAETGRITNRLLGGGGAATPVLDSLGGFGGEASLQPGGEPGTSVVAPEHLGLHARLVAMEAPQAAANLLERWMQTEEG